MIIKMLLFPAAILLVLYFIIVQIVPTAQDVSTAKDMIVKEQKKLEEANQQLTEVQSFKSNIQTHTAEQAFVVDFVPNDQREEILLSDISQLAEETNLDLFSVGFSEGNQGVRNSALSLGSVYTMEGKAIVSGTYDDMKQFMNKMFLIKRLYAFKTFDLTKARQSDEDGMEGQPMILSGVVSFAYKYIPATDNVSPSSVGGAINFDLINTVMNATSETQPLVTETEYRANPFLP